MNNPIDDLEQQRSMEEMGMFGSRVYRGARSDGATRAEAFMVVAAWFYSLVMQGNSERLDGEE